MTIRPFCIMPSVLVWSEAPLNTVLMSLSVMVGDSVLVSVCPRREALSASISATWLVRMLAVARNAISAPNMASSMKIGSEKANSISASPD